MVATDTAEHFVQTASSASSPFHASTAKTPGMITAALALARADPEKKG
jgi:hypothetical protein